MDEHKNIDEMIRAEKRAYYRQYRAKNKERVNANNRRYWERRALKRQAEREATRNDKQQ